MILAPGTFQGLHEDEVALFRQVLAGVSGQGVEIGCLDGFSSAVILDASELHLTSIDPFVPDSMEPSLIGLEERYRQNVAPYGARAHILKDYSGRVAMMKRAESVDPIAPHLDFLFIDGDHDYENVLLDYEDWTPWLIPGGLLAMHDARMYRDHGATFHPGPSRVASEQVFGNPLQWEIVGEAFSLVIARKR